MNGDSTHGLQDVNVINDEIKALFESVERLLKLSPSPGVQTQWNRQQRSFKEEAIQCSEANLKFKKRWKEIRNANQRRQINNNGTHGDINSIESQLQNPRQFQVRVERRSSDAHNHSKFTSRRATPVRELIERSNRIHQYEENIEDINDMTAYLHKLVHRQEPSIVQIEDNVVTTARESGKASAELDDAAASAQNNRRWKWYAFILSEWVCLIICIQAHDSSVGYCYCLGNYRRIPHWFSSHRQTFPQQQGVSGHKFELQNPCFTSGIHTFRTHYRSLHRAPCMRTHSGGNFWSSGCGICVFAKNRYTVM